jgi:hypothetical protein
MAENGLEELPPVGHGGEDRTMRREVQLARVRFRPGSVEEIATKVEQPFPFPARLIL